jgi:peptidoglycan/xylan/chitin deacetylase (PgdA/CDA1 family)
MVKYSNLLKSLSWVANPAKVLSLVGVGVGLLLQQRWVLRIATQVKPGALYFVEPDRPLIALTIDDGPYPGSTEKILDILDTHGARATFFLLSDHIAGQEPTIQRLVARGHEIGNHLTEDEASIRLSETEFTDKFLAADRVLSAYAQPRWWRPGMGWYSGQMVAIATQQGYRLALGSVFPYDTHLPSVAFAEWFILNRVQPGDIVILHDGDLRGERTSELLARILPVLKHRGYEIVTLTELYAG